MREWDRTYINGTKLPRQILAAGILLIGMPLDVAGTEMG